jgi:replicative DNA helicase
MFGELERRQARKGPRQIGELAIERIDYYTAVEQGDVAAGWLTGIPELDSRLNGGLRPGNVYVLAARPSVGKSSFAQAIAVSMARDGLPALFLSMEMTDAEVTDRAVSNSGRVSYKRLLTGRMANEDWGRTSEAMDILGPMPLFIDDEGGLTVRDIRFKAKGVKGLKVLVVDYLQLASGSRRDGNRNGEIEEISRGLKGLAKELGIAIIALSQLNRDVEKRASKRPMMSDLRDSGAIEQDADVVMFLWPVRDFPAEGRRIVGLGIDKNRQGPQGQQIGDIGLDFFGDTQRWSQSTADIRPDPAVRGRPDL